MLAGLTLCLRELKEEFIAVKTKYEQLKLRIEKEKEDLIRYDHERMYYYDSLCTLGLTPLPSLGYHWDGEGKAQRNERRPPVQPLPVLLGRVQGIYSQPISNQTQQDRQNANIVDSIFGFFK